MRVLPQRTMKKQLIIKIQTARPSQVSQSVADVFSAPLHSVEEELEHHYAGAVSSQVLEEALQFNCSPANLFPRSC